MRPLPSPCTWLHPFALLTLTLKLTAAVAVAVPGLTAADWPQWRGPSRTGLTPEVLPASLPVEPRPVWKQNTGGGASGVVVVGEVVFLFQEDGKDEVLVAYDRGQGRELWRTPIGPRFQDEWGPGPRSTPIVDGPFVFAQSCTGRFRCLQRTDGKEVWSVDFQSDFGVTFLGNKVNEGTARRRGNNGSGVIDGDRLILPVGGSNGNSLVCFHKSSGKVLWKSGNDEAAYSSLMTATLAGKRQVVALLADALHGVDLSDGRELWSVPLSTAAKRHVATPVVHGNRVIVNSHTIGLIAFELASRGTGQTAVPAWSNPALKINLATPVLVDGHLYSLGADHDFVCVDAQSGKVRWSQSGFGQGRKDSASTITDGKRLLTLTEDGQAVLIAANPVKYEELGRFQACGNTWAFPAYADGSLYVRDLRTLARFDLLPSR